MLSSTTRARKHEMQTTALQHGPEGREDPHTGAIDSILFMICTGPLASTPYNAEYPPIEDSQCAALIEQIRATQWTWHTRDQLGDIRDQLFRHLPAKWQLDCKDQYSFSSLLDSLLRGLNMRMGGMGTFEFCRQHECGWAYYTPDNCLIAHDWMTEQTGTLSEQLTEHFSIPEGAGVASCSVCEDGEDGSNLRVLRILDIEPPSLLIIQDIAWHTDYSADDFTIDVPAMSAIGERQPRLLKYRILYVVSITGETKEAQNDSEPDEENCTYQVYTIYDQKNGMGSCYCPAASETSEESPNVWRWNSRDEWLVALSGLRRVTLLLQLVE